MAQPKKIYRCPQSVRKIEVFPTQVTRLFTSCCNRAQRAQEVLFNLKDDHYYNYYLL